MTKLRISSRYPIRTRTGAYLLHHMESIFARLLMPDNETIRQVTALYLFRWYIYLLYYFRPQLNSRKCIGIPLLSLPFARYWRDHRTPRYIEKTGIKHVKMSICYHMQYRQYAAVLLRKRLVKLWKKLDDETHNKYTALVMFYRSRAYMVYTVF